MKRWQVFLLVGMITTVFQVWSWFLGALLAALSLAKTADTGLKKMGAPDWLRRVGTGGYGVYSVYQDNEAKRAADEAERAQADAGKFNMPYRRSEHMPDRSGGYSPMARYSPGNRQASSGVDPQLMAYLRSFTQPR